jgi:ABC-2 type transport system permease protein
LVLALSFSPSVCGGLSITKEEAMNAIRLTFAVTWKEIQLLLRDRGAMALYFLMPLMLAGLMGGPQAINWQADAAAEGPAITLKLAVVNEDEGTVGAQVVDALKQVDIFIVQTIPDAVQADELVADRETDAAVIIPAAFSRQIETYSPTDVQLILDPSQAETAGLLSGVLDTIIDEFNLVSEIRYGIHTLLDESGVLAEAEPGFQEAVEAQTLGVIMTQLNERRANPAINLVSEDMSGHSRSEYLGLILVSMFPGYAVLFAYIVVTAVTDAMFSEKESGSFRRLLAAPIPPAAIIGGKMLAYMLLIGFQILVMILVGGLLFGMPTGQSPLALILVTFAMALSVTAIGMFLAAVTRNQAQANSLGLVVVLVMGAIGGCIISIPEMLVFRSQSFMGTLARLTPQGHVMEAYVRVMGEGAGVVDVLPQIGALLGISLVLYLLAIWRFRFE